MDNIEISAKQKQAIDIAFNPQVTELLYGGANGSGKSFVVCQICVLFAKMYPGVRIFIGRRTLKSLKQSTINTLINKVHPAMGVGFDEYNLHLQDMTLDYKNGSVIIFGELEHKPSDDEYGRLGSLEIDFGIIEEAGEVGLRAFTMLKSRTGRGILAKYHNIPGFVIATANPAQNFLKTRFYDPYEKLGGGGYQQWEIGKVEIGGEDKPAYRAFLSANAYDNPFLPQSYIDNLNSLPDMERKRAFGDWNYADEDNMLFKVGLLDKATTYELPDPGDLYIGVDVAAQGKDRSCYTLIKNGVVIAQKISSVQMNWDKNSEKPLFRLMADELIEFAMKNGFTSREAKHIAIEGNGIGQALVSSIKERGWAAMEFTATHKSRSENYNQLQLDFDSGDLKLYHEMNGLEDLRKELLAHTFEMNNQEISVEKKEKIKLRLGRSPDLSDALAIANWCRHQNTDKLGDRYNSARIIF